MDEATFQEAMASLDGKAGENKDAAFEEVKSLIKFLHEKVGAVSNEKPLDHLEYTLNRISGMIVEAAFTEKTQASF
jgi:hypothetical protein